MTTKFSLFVLLLISASTASSQGILDKIKDTVDDAVDKAGPQTTVDVEAMKGLSLLDSETQNCRGRWGMGCQGTYEDLRNPPSVRYPCDGDENTVCVTSGMTIGSIKHDICCDTEEAQGRTGHFCHPTKPATVGKDVCEPAWDQAKKDWSNKKFFRHEWRYRIGENSTGDSAEWWRNIVPEGVRVTQSDPKQDEIYCQSGSVEKKSGKWVCTAITAPPPVAQPTPAANETNSVESSPTSSADQLADNGSIGPSATPVANAESFDQSQCFAGYCLGQRLDSVDMIEFELVRGDPNLREKNIMRWRSEPRCTNKAFYEIKTMDSGLYLNFEPTVRDDGRWDGPRISAITKRYKLSGSQQRQELVNQAEARFPNSEVEVTYGRGRDNQVGVVSVQVRDVIEGTRQRWTDQVVVSTILRDRDEYSRLIANTTKKCAASSVSLE